MSNKKTKSVLPNGGFQMTDGINYGLDGFQFDTEYGGGVLDRARLPETKGLSSLPDDMVAFSEGSELPTIEKKADDELLGDLSSMLSENSLAELGWLHGEQDPDRLPKNPVDRGIMELEKAWGAGNSTNGIIPNRDKEVVDFELSLQKEGSDQTASEEELLEVVNHAHRRSALGHPIKDILRDCVTRLGSDTQYIKDDLEIIRDEHGLAGNVFVYASAFPGIHNGKWKKLFKKLGCRYLVAEDTSLSNFTDLEIVREVPWKQALSHYSSRLNVEGRKLAKDLGAKETLRIAFLSQSKNLSPKSMREIKPVERREVDHITQKEALAQFEKSEKQQREVVLSADRELAQQRKKAQVQIAKWVKANLLTREQGLKFAKSTAKPIMILRLASELIAHTTKSSSYSGTENNSTSTVSQRAFSILARAEEKERNRLQAVNQNRRLAAERQIEKWKSQGVLTSYQAKLLLREKDNELLLRKASAVVSENMKRKQAFILKKQKTATYSGTVERVHQSETPQIDVVGETKKVNQSRLASATKWIRRQMCEGMIGKNLSQLIASKFTKDFVSENDTEIKKVRKAHEGLSGHIYVDAEAYATPEGTKGCEKGALIHRANTVACVKSMARCSTCVFANKCTSGRYASETIVCQKYNKPLVDEIPVENRDDYQKEMIRLANATDAEQTASIFASAYDQSEFSLSNDSLTNFDLDETIVNGSLEGILFGGFEVE